MKQKISLILLGPSYFQSCFWRATLHPHCWWRHRRQRRSRSASFF